MCLSVCYHLSPSVSQPVTHQWCKLFYQFYYGLIVNERVVLSLYNWQIFSSFCLFGCLIVNNDPACLIVYLALSYFISINWFAPMDAVQCTVI